MGKIREEKAGNKHEMDVRHSSVINTQDFHWIFTVCQSIRLGVSRIQRVKHAPQAIGARQQYFVLGPHLLPYFVREK